MQSLRSDRPALRVCVAPLLWLATIGASSTTLLSLERPAAATLAHAGDTRRAQAHDALEAGDAVYTGAGGSAALMLGHYGEIELGPAAAVTVQRLPFSSFATDLSTELKLDAGMLHLVWKYPALSAPWPLVVALGPLRATLASGEYFFGAGAAPTICVRSGQVAIETGGQLLPAMLKPSACYRFEDSQMPPAQPRSEADFIAMRQTHTLDTPPAQVAAAGTSIPYTVPRQRRPAAAAPAAAAPVAPVSAPTVPIVAPPAAPVSAVPPVDSSTPAPAHGWLVVACSLETPADAQRERGKLQAAGYTAVVEPAEVKGRTWYRVQVQGADSLEAARALAAQIKQKLAYADPWVRKQ